MVMPPTREEIPESLLEYDHWICWRTEDRDGKRTNVPIDPSTGEFASTTDPETWTRFVEAGDYVESGAADALGFVFSDDDPIVGVDLDDCRDPETCQSDDWAMSVVETLDSFTEVSPSGTGYHVLLRGSLPEGRNRKGDLEVYEDVATLETSRLKEGVAYDVTYYETAAAEWASANCERGDGKRFGPCEAAGGVAMQERAGEAVLLAVGLDVRVVGPDGETELTVAVGVGR